LRTSRIETDGAEVTALDVERDKLSMKFLLTGPVTLDRATGALPRFAMWRT
jgi:hypothetical protein